MQKALNPYFGLKSEEIMYLHQLHHRRRTPLSGAPGPPEIT